MRVHLVAPSREEPFGARPGVFLAPPLALAALASVTPPEMEVTLSDENLGPIDFDQPADLVGITSTTQTANHAYRAADTFRARGLPVVLGGIHPSALPEEAVQHADAVVVGEGEDIWPQVLADSQEGKLKPLYRAETRPDLARLPAPRRDIFQRRHYLCPDTVYTARGCPYGCSFCSVTSFFGGTYRWRPVEEVAKEIQGLQGRRMFLLVDDNVIGHPGHSRDLFRVLAACKVPWIGQASLTIARDESLLAMAFEAGCRALFLGIESISPESLRSVHKRHNAVEEYEQAIRRIQSHGISIYGAFIFGLDHDTEDTFVETVRFARRTRLEVAQFSILTPYPGTVAMATMERDGRLLTKNWDDYREDRVVFQPKLVSPQRLQEGHDWAWREFYSLGSIFQRVGPFHTYSPLLWAVNFMYRSDPVSKAFFNRMSSWASSFL
ncbi:MAG: radical SAM protein [Dehalococcoidales bacterium]|nr:radical SAM protein [Dehalococcoidales bacterium]